MIEGKVEVSIAVDLIANITIHVEPGTVVTQEMIDEAINAINTKLVDTPVRGSGVALYVEIFRNDKDVSLAAYDGEDEWTLNIGEAVGKTL